MYGGDSHRACAAAIGGRPPPLPVGGPTRHDLLLPDRRPGTRHLPRCRCRRGASGRKRVDKKGHGRGRRPCLSPPCPRPILPAALWMQCFRPPGLPLVIGDRRRTKKGGHPIRLTTHPPLGTGGCAEWQAVSAIGPPANPRGARRPAGALSSLAAAGAAVSDVGGARSTRRGSGRECQHTRKTQGRRSVTFGGVVTILGSIARTVERGRFSFRARCAAHRNAEAQRSLAAGGA